MSDKNIPLFPNDHVRNIALYFVLDLYFIYLVDHSLILYIRVLTTHNHKKISIKKGFYPSLF